MDKLERPKKKIKLAAAKTDSALTALATNVSSMGNRFNTVIKQNFEYCSSQCGCCEANEQYFGIDA